MENIQSNSKSFGDQTFYVSPEDWDRYLTVFKQNKKFNRIFYKNLDNSALNLYGLEYVRHSPTGFGFVFRMTNPKLWMLMKIKYGI